MLEQDLMTLDIDEKLARIADAKGVGYAVCSVFDALKEYEAALQCMFPDWEDIPPMNYEDLKDYMAEELDDTLAEIQFAVCQLVYLLGIGSKVLLISHEMANKQLRDLFPVGEEHASEMMCKNKDCIMQNGKPCDAWYGCGGYEGVEE